MAEQLSGIPQSRPGVLHERSPHIQPLEDVHAGADWPVLLHVIVVPFAILTFNQRRHGQSSMAFVKPHNHTCPS